jgi:hypothetical protein
MDTNTEFKTRRIQDCLMVNPANTLTVGQLKERLIQFKDDDTVFTCGKYGFDIVCDLERMQMGDVAVCLLVGIKGTGETK